MNHFKYLPPEFLPCQGISSPRGHSDALSGSSGWFAGAGSACRTETGRKWAGYRTRQPLEIAGPGCKYLFKKTKRNSQHLLQRQERETQLGNDDGDGWEKKTGQNARRWERHRMPRDLLCAPPWSSRNRTGWLTPMEFPWLCTRLTDKTNNASLLTP